MEGVNDNYDVALLISCHYKRALLFFYDVSHIRKGQLQLICKPSWCASITTKPNNDSLTRGQTPKPVYAMSIAIKHVITTHHRICVEYNENTSNYIPASQHHTKEHRKQEKTSWNWELNYTYQIRRFTCVLIDLQF